MKKILIFSSVLILIVLLLPEKSVRADIAPPETPPGSNLVPGIDSTQVRMESETVRLVISKDPADPQNAIARITASFTMRNLGSVQENMQVRFPLSFFNGSSDGMGNYPEISGINVKIGGKSVPKIREMQPYLASKGQSYEERIEIPWAVFDVSFPPSQDVFIDVNYTVSGYGYYPYEAFQYILETGAGWKGTIGVVDIIVEFPYEVNEKNAGNAEADYAGYGNPTPGGTFSGRELRWHFEDLEPTQNDNIQILLVTPSLWESVLRESYNVIKNPSDGEAWGRLGKAYKEIVRMPKGYLREDPGGHEMFQLSRSAYEKCLELLPEDPVWHFGYADLLWSYYYFDIRGAGKADPEGILPLILTHLKRAIEINPRTQQVIDLLTEISYSMPEAVQLEGDGFVFLGLTATPVPPTPWALPTDLLEPTPTIMNISTSTLDVRPPPTESFPTQEPEPGNSLCGSAAFIFPISIGLVVILKRRYS